MTTENKIEYIKSTVVGEPHFYSKWHSFPMNNTDMNKLYSSTKEFKIFHFNTTDKLSFILSVVPAGICQELRKE